VNDSAATTPGAQESKVSGVRKLLYLAVAVISVLAMVLLTASRHGGWTVLWETLHRDPIKAPLFVVPCFILGLTAHAYAPFIDQYNKGFVSILTLICTVIAWTLCLMLVESEGWDQHLRVIYGLFFSYVVWDILMVDIVLKGESSGTSAEDLRAKTAEICAVSYMINVPTLITVFIVWCFAHYMKANAVTDETLDTYVSGVVSFHLAFASVAYLATIWMYRSSTEGDKARCE